MVFFRAADLDGSKVEYQLHKAAALMKVWQIACSTTKQLSIHDVVFFIFHIASLLILLDQLGSLDPAIACCDKVIAQEPNNAKAFLRKGMVLIQQGKLDLAKQTLTAGQALDPNNKTFGTWLSKCGKDEATVTNKQLGQCDDALSALFEAHGQQGYPLVETVRRCGIASKVSRRCLTLPGAGP